jgi:hypothetical protein
MARGPRPPALVEAGRLRRLSGWDALEDELHRPGPEPKLGPGYCGSRLKGLN